MGAKLPAVGERPSPFDCVEQHNIDRRRCMSSDGSSVQFTAVSPRLPVRDLARTGRLLHRAAGLRARSALAAGRSHFAIVRRGRCSFNSGRPRPRTRSVTRSLLRRLDGVRCSVRSRPSGRRLGTSGVYLWSARIRDSRSRSVPDRLLRGNGRRSHRRRALTSVTRCSWSFEQIRASVRGLRRGADPGGLQCATDQTPTVHGQMATRPYRCTVSRQCPCQTSARLLSALLFAQ